MGFRIGPQSSLRAAALTAGESLAAALPRHRFGAAHPIRKRADALAA